MRLPFTKMQGAGNDFVVLDGTRAPVVLSRAQLRRLGDRRFGVGADQILAVEASTVPGIDFVYRIFNGASGDEVEHCGNGARCFLRYVHAHGLSQQPTLRVQTINRVLTLHMQSDGRVTVDMAQPVFDHSRIPFDATGLSPRRMGQFELWPIDGAGLAGIELATLSMGNPHAVLRVDDVDAAPVATLGPLIEKHARFAQQVNVGFLQVLSRSAIKLRVFERSAGETLACGTGACAAIVAGIRLGWLGADVEVHTRGGALRVQWDADLSETNPASVLMTGPAEIVYEGEIEL
jgi:diaminopimelate epimerase